MHTVHKTSSSRALEGEREVGVGQRRAGMNGPSDQRKPCGCQEPAGGHLQAPWAPGSEISGEIFEHLSSSELGSTRRSLAQCSAGMYVPNPSLRPRTCLEKAGGYFQHRFQIRGYGYDFPSITLREILSRNWGLLLFSQHSRGGSI